MAEDYNEKVLRLDNQSLRETLSVANCKRVAQLFRDAQNGVQHQGQDHDFCWLYDLSETSDAIPQKERFAARYAKSDANNEQRNQILFLSGYPDVTLIKQIGDCFELDPAIFDRHLSYYKNDITTCDIHPSYYNLPSRQQGVFQASVTSVGGLTGNSHPKSLGARRSICAEKMKEYLHTSRVDGRWMPSQSVVRSFELYDDLRFSLSQAITVSIKHEKDANHHWLLLIWSDAGLDLMNSPPKGPWHDPLLTPGIHFRPVLLHKDTSAPDGQPSLTSTGSRAPRDLSQSLCMLPKQYGISLNPKLMAQDPTYAMAELLSFIAAAEAQYLDMVHSVFNTNISQAKNPGSADKDWRNILVFAYRGLNRHRRHTAATFGFIQHSLDRLDQDSDPAIRAMISKICSDYEYLLDAFDRLRERCDHEVNLIMSEASVEEALWSRQQSRNNLKFTVLATLYVPLSFSNSIFGMNFVEPENLQEGFKFWAIVTFPILLISILFLAWDERFFQHQMLRGRFSGAISKIRTNQVNTGMV